MRKTNTKELYTIGADGQLNFNSTIKSRRSKTRPESFVSSLPFQIFLLLLCAFTEFASFNQMFEVTLYNNLFSRIVMIAAMLVGFEILPILLATSLKKMNQGISVKRFLPILYILGFVIAITVNMYLRYNTRDIVFPNLDDYATSTFGNITVQDSVSPIALPFSIFFGIIPIITALVNFGCAYSMFDPLSKITRPLEEEIEALKNEIQKIEATIVEYDADQDFLSRMRKGEDERRKNSVKMIKSKCREYQIYVRDRIKEFTLNPAAISELSKKHISVLHIDNDEELEIAV